MKTIHDLPAFPYSVFYINISSTTVEISISTYKTLEDWVIWDVPKTTLIDYGLNVPAWCTNEGEMYCFDVNLFKSEFPNFGAIYLTYNGMVHENINVPIGVVVCDNRTIYGSFSHYLVDGVFDNLELGLSDLPTSNFDFSPYFADFPSVSCADVEALNNKITTLSNKISVLETGLDYPSSIPSLTYGGSNLFSVVKDNVGSTLTSPCSISNGKLLFDPIKVFDSLDVNIFSFSGSSTDGTAYSVLAFEDAGFINLDDLYIRFDNLYIKNVFDSALSKIVAKNNALNASFSSLSSSFSDKEASLELKYGSLSTKISELSATVSSNAFTISNLEATKLSLETSLTEKNDLILSLRSDYDTSLSTIYDEKNIALSDLKTSTLYISDLEAIVDSLKTKISTLETEKETLLAISKVNFQNLVIPETLTSLNGLGCQYKDGAFVEIKGSEGIYVVIRSFSVYIADNNYTVMYDCQNDLGRSLCSPEAMLTIVAPAITAP